MNEEDEAMEVAIEEEHGSYNFIEGEFEQTKENAIQFFLVFAKERRRRAHPRAFWKLENFYCQNRRRTQYRVYAVNQKSF